MHTKLLSAEVGKHTYALFLVVHATTAVKTIERSYTWLPPSVRLLYFVSCFPQANLANTSMEIDRTVSCVENPSTDRLEAHLLTVTLFTAMTVAAIN
jgi:hypothetical protein